MHLAYPFKTEAELEFIKKRCLRKVKNRSMLAAASAIVPIPFADAMLSFGLAVELLNSISHEFMLVPEDIDGYDPHVKALIAFAIKHGGKRFVGAVATEKVIMSILPRFLPSQAAKIVPVIGHACCAFVNYYTLKAVCEIHIEDCMKVAKTIIDHGCWQENIGSVF